MIPENVIKNSPPLAKAILDRRMIRQYTDEQISDETIKQIIELAGRSSSSLNTQPWRLIAVKNKEKLKQLNEYAPYNPQVGLSASTFIIYSDMKDVLDHAKEIVSPNLEDSIREEKAEGLKKYFANKTSKEIEIWGLGQTYIFLGYLQLSIQAFSYSSATMLGFFPEKVKEAFELPERVHIAALVSLGKAGEEGVKSHRHAVDRILKII